MIDKITELIWTKLEPKIAEVAEDAYKKGAEDIIRRFSFVYDAVRQTAKEDAYAEAGALDIDQITGEQFKEMTQ